MFQIEFDNDKAVGIDLGTTNSLVAWMSLARPEVLPIVPSIVSLSPSGEIIVGEKARQELIDHPDPPISPAKPLMARGIPDFQEELKLFPFRIGDDSESIIRALLGERTFTPP